MNNPWDPGTSDVQEVREDCVYSREHEFARKEADGTYTIGITPFAINQLGDITLVGIDIDVGSSIEAGSEIGTIESVKTLSDLYSPITGVVVAINEELEDNPELVNDSPWEDGWLIRMKPESEEAEKEGYTTRDCISPQEYSEYTSE